MSSLEQIYSSTSMIEKKKEKDQKHHMGLGNNSGQQNMEERQFSPKINKSQEGAANDTGSVGQSTKDQSLIHNYETYTEMEKQKSNERIRGIREVERSQTLQEGAINMDVQLSQKSNKHGAANLLPPGMRSSTDMSENQHNIQKELSTMIPSVISAIQGQSPSYKFHAQLLQRQKAQEEQIMQNRVAELQREDDRANKLLRQTILAHQTADEVSARKQNDHMMKTMWLQDKQQRQENQRIKNQQLREERKANISHNRKNHILKNILDRDSILEDLHQKNKDFNKRAMADFQKTSQQTANIYLWKKEAKEKSMNDFQNNLSDVKKHCQHRARNSIAVCSAHEERIARLELREKNVIDSLQQTVVTKNGLLNDLKRKSHALTNQIQPRRPQQIKNKQYYKHSEFGFHNFDSTNSMENRAQQNYQMMLNSISDHGSEQSKSAIKKNLFQKAGRYQHVKDTKPFAYGNVYLNQQSHFAKTSRNSSPQGMHRSSPQQSQFSTFQDDQQQTQ